MVLLPAPVPRSGDWALLLAVLAAGVAVAYERGRTRHRGFAYHLPKFLVSNFRQKSSNERFLFPFEFQVSVLVISGESMPER